MITMVEKSVKHYIEWCSQNRKRWDFGPRYDGIMISVENDFGVVIHFWDLVNGGLQALGGISFFQASNFTWNAVKIMSADPLGPELRVYL